MSAADSEEMSAHLMARGFSTTRRLESADALLLNTCTIRQHAEDRVLSLLGRLKPWKRERPERLLIVAGCAAERLGGWIRRKFPHVDLVVGAKSIEQVPSLLDDALAGRFDWERENRGVWGRPQAWPNSNVSQYVTIMRGCNYSCSYCIVPAVRGRESYRPMEAVLAEVRGRAASGAREVMLLGQTVNSYRPAVGVDFSLLLKTVDAVAGIERIRFMSPHPYYLDERQIEAMAGCAKLCRHLHLPVQSGSDAVLERMRRNYTADEYLEKVRRLRDAMPGVAITTDFIVGFPGETEEDFQRTLELARELDPCSAYCFAFSPRAGTPAAKMKGQVPAAVRQERLRRLLSQVEKRMQEHLGAWIGKKVRVLLEDERHGRTEEFFKARLSRPAQAGQIIEGTVAAATRTALSVSCD